MKHWDQLREIANDNYGLITFDEARTFCVAGVELTRWTKNGWLEKRGWGVYRLAAYYGILSQTLVDAIRVSSKIVPPILCKNGQVFGE